MKFKVVTFIQLAAAISGTLVSIILAYNGFSYMSMAWGAIATALVTALSCLVYRPKNIPLKFTLNSFKYIWSYSSYSVLASLVRYTAQSIPELLTGKMLGMASVGILSKGRSTANMVSQVFIHGMKAVTFPMFTAIREDKKHSREQYLKLVDITLGLVWPVLLFIGINAEYIITVLFGKNWLEATPILQVALLGLSIWTCITYADDLLKSNGRIALLSKLEIIFLPLYAVFVYFSIQFGLIAMMFSLVSLTAIRFLIYLFLLSNTIGIPKKAYLYILLKNLLLSAPIALFLLVLFSYLSSHNITNFFNLVISSIAFAVVWLLSIFLFKHAIFMTVIQPIIGKFIRGKT